MDEQNYALKEIFQEFPHYYRIGTSAKGRGLFALDDIPPRTLLHVAPCIEIMKSEYEDHLKHTILENYVFNTSAGNKLLALGHGSLFNHSSKPNVDYRVNSREGCIRYFSGHAVIARGAELCISYGDNLWFEDTDNTVQQNNPSSSDEEDDFLKRLQLED